MGWIAQEANMTEAFNWNAPPLSAEDQRLIDEYVRVGRSVDDLAFTKEFEDFCDRLLGRHDRETQRDVFLRLLRLRKQARLPLPTSVPY
jgi:hypothetical protein